MTDIADRIRSTALALPETREEADGDATVFLVADHLFARMTGTTLSVRDDRDWQDASLAGDIDWPMVDDRIARGWELAAPRRLLEAGGR